MRKSCVFSDSVSYPLTQVLETTTKKIIPQHFTTLAVHLNGEHIQWRCMLLYIN